MELPNDIKRCIASYLDEKSKWKLYRTSREWKYLLCWTDFLIEGFINDEQVKEIAQHMQLYHRTPIGLEFMELINITIESLKWISNLTHLTTLGLGSYQNNGPVQDLSEYLTSLSNLQSLECIRLSEQAYQHLTNLTNLSTGWFYPINYPKLRSLSIICNSSIVSPIDLAKWNISTLTALTLSRTGLRMCQALATQLTTLKYLNIRNCNYEMEGEDTFKNLTAIDLKHMTRLEYLAVGLILTDFPTTLTTLKIDTEYIQLENTIKYTTNLRNLSLNPRPMAGFNIDFRKFPYLETLSVCGVASKNIKELSAEKLNRLHIANSADITDLSRLTSLRDLIVDNCSFDSIDIFTTLTNLTSLCIRHNEEITVEIHQLTKLNELYLQLTANRVNLKISKLTNLTLLDVRNFDQFPYLEVPTSLASLTIQALTPEPNSIDLSVYTALYDLTRLRITEALVNSWNCLPEFTALRNLSLVDSKSDTVQDTYASVLTNLVFDYYF